MNRVRRTAVVEKLFPAGVVAFESCGIASPDDLFPSERECVAQSVEGRMREFAAGRLCARAGLVALGFEPTPLLRAPDRTPIWPPGIVGSISHTEGYCVAVVGFEAQFAAIGVDTERIGHVNPSLWPITMHAEELRTLQSLEEAAGRQMATVIFSAKEAFYKCQYALTHRWLDFNDVIVGMAGGTFEVSVVEETNPFHHLLIARKGSFLFDGAIVVAGIAFERRTASIP